MLKYCTNCKKNYDFKIKSMTDLDNLQCPECGKKIDKNSSKPVDHSESDKVSNSLGKMFYNFARIGYLFYITISVAGIISYFLNWNKPLYITTGICVGFFLIQLIIGYCSFRSGIIFIPLGAAAGYLILKTVNGACLGILTVFVIRHLFRKLFFWIIGKIVSIK